MEADHHGLTTKGTLVRVSSNSVHRLLKVGGSAADIRHTTRYEHDADAVSHTAMLSMVIITVKSAGLLSVLLSCFFPAAVWTWALHCCLLWYVSQFKLFGKLLQPGTWAAYRVGGPVVCCPKEK